MTQLKDLTEEIRRNRDPHQVRNRLQALFNHLSYDLESKREHGVFLPDVVTRHPYWSRQVDQLENSCRQLLAELQSMLRQPHHRSVDKWLDRLHELMERENELVFEAYNRDIGGEH